MAEATLIIDGEEFTCPTLTDAQYVGKKPYGAAYGDLKVYIPALMPKVSMGLAKKLPAVTINKTMFCNSKECQITPMSKVIPQNYVTAKSYKHTEFQRPHLDFGTTIEVHADDHDFQATSISTNKDPSTFHQ